MGPRQTQDTGPRNAFGRYLVEELCLGASAVILNGRTPGDLEGACTCFTTRAGRVTGSVLDYGICSKASLEYVKRFMVGGREPRSISDHCMITCDLAYDWAPPAPREEGVQARCPKYNPAKRLEYVLAVQSKASDFDAVLTDLRAAQLLELWLLVSLQTSLWIQPLKCLGGPLVALGVPSVGTCPRSGSGTVPRNMLPLSGLVLVATLMLTRPYSDASMQPREGGKGTTTRLGICVFCRTCGTTPVGSGLLIEERKRWRQYSTAWRIWLGIGANYLVELVREHCKRGLMTYLG